MNKKEEFSQEILRINHIVLKAQEAVEIVAYLLEPETDHYRAYQKKMNMFFYYSIANYWQIAVMELVKLFYFKPGKKEETDNREKFNIRHLIKKIRRGGYFGDFAIADSTLDKWLEELDHNDELIKNLMEQRDKLYAHEDRNNQTVVNKASFAEVRNLLAIAIKLIKAINLATYQQGISFDLINSPAHNLKFLVEMLADKERAKMEAYRPIARQYGLEDELPNN
jgi:hypothetical protein